MSETTTRVYEPIWVQLKQPPHRVRLQVEPALVQRVKKAVSKEKYNDDAFKLQFGHKGEEDYFFIAYTYNVNTKILEIVLKNRWGVDLADDTEVRV